MARLRIAAASPATAIMARRPQATEFEGDRAEGNAGATARKVQALMIPKPCPACSGARSASRGATT